MLSSTLSSTLPSALAAFAVTLGLAVAWLRLNDFAAHRGWMSSRTSRKIIHIGTGPLFVLCWLLFPPSPGARYVAALVPLAITIQFALVGLGLLKDPAAVQAMSRTGDRREILRGPLFYGIVFVALTILYWKDTPIGMTALMLMCGGDGLADLVGRRYGRARLPWNAGKSWAGSLGMLFGGWACAAAVLAVYTAAGVFPQPFSAYLLPLAVIAFAGMVVESLPFRDIDNLTVTFTAALLGHLFF
jgi:phytol kinase